MQNPHRQKLPSTDKAENVIRIVIAMLWLGMRNELMKSSKESLEIEECGEAGKFIGDDVGESIEYIDDQGGAAVAAGHP